MEGDQAKEHTKPKHALTPADKRGTTGVTPRNLRPSQPHHPPNLLIIINGGAKDFVLHPPRLERLFSKGIADAARDAKAVLMTAGTDIGAAKLVAEAVQAPCTLF